MKLGFVFDTKFKRYEGNYYSTNLSSEFLTNRYLKYFDEMVVVCRYEPVAENPSGKYLQSNCEKIEFKAIRNENPLKRIIHFKRDSAYIKDVLSECDAIICRGWRGTKISKNLQKKYLVEVVNCAWDAYWNHGFLGKFVAPIMFLLRKMSTKEAPYVLYVTNKFLQRRYPTNGEAAAISDVKLEEFESRIIEKRIDRINNKGNNEKIIIGTAAAIDVPYKGQKYVMLAIADLKKKGICNYEYQVAGGGNKKNLERIAKRLGIENQVCFLGSIQHNDIFQWYDSIDIYIQPSLQEGLPRALIEAMSRGVLCYGTKTGGIPELLPKECVCKNNFFLRRKIAKLVSQYNKELAKKYAIQNIGESQNYSIAFLEKKWENFFAAFYKDVKEDNKKYD